MADFNWSNMGSGLLGLAGTFVNAYKGGPKADTGEILKKKAAMVGEIEYHPTDTSGLMRQFENTPQLRDVSSRDLYNPSSEELFGHFMSSGMSAYNAASSLTSGMAGMFNKGNAPTSATTSGTMPALTMTSSVAEDNPELANAIANNSVAAQNGWQEVQGIPVNPDQYSFACGGHKFANGGVTGKGLGTGINLLAAFGAIGAAAAGQANQQKLAEGYAAEVDANNAYARQLNAHNFNNAVFDTKNNMHNMQALQMMAMGGDLQTLGADFPLNGGYNVIGAGGTHEQNPNGGVFQGMAADGKPNLVEENEVVWNDYVFSNRINIPNGFAKTYKLRNKISYADAAQKLIEEAKERPNDPISQNGIADALGALQISQEETKQKREAARMKRAINKMSPEELMQLVSAAQSAQTPEGAQMPQMPEGMGAVPQDTELPQEMPAEGPQMGVGSEETPFADGGHMFKRGGTTKPSSEADAKRTRALLTRMSPMQLAELAQAYNGYDPAVYNMTNSAPIIDFIMANQAAGNSYNDIQSRIAAAKNFRILGDSELPQYTMTDIPNQSWEDFFKILENYDESLKRAVQQGKYKIDPGFNFNGKTAIEAEDEPGYKEFTKYIIDHATDPNVVRYLHILDGRINKQNGAETIFDENGMLKKGWDKMFENRKNDGLGGIYHFWKDMSSRHNGKRTIYRMNGQPIEVSDPNALSKFVRQVGKPTYETTIDESGNPLTTEYIDLEGLDFDAPEPAEEVQPQQGLPTWMRYAPAIGAFAGMFQGPAKDYSTAVSPIFSSYAPIGDYLAYNPVDTQRYINAENKQAAAQLNAIMNAGVNRNAALAQVAYANQQRQQNIGKILEAAEQVNFGRRNQVGEFNRGTNQFNASAYNHAALADMQVPNFLLHQDQNNQRMKYQADAARDAAVSASTNAFLESLGNIGNENIAWNQVNSNQALRFGSNSDPFGGQGVSFYKAFGGQMLTKKNRR